MDINQWMVFSLSLMPTWLLLFIPPMFNFTQKYEANKVTVCLQGSDVSSLDFPNEGSDMDTDVSEIANQRVSLHVTVN